MMQEKKYGNTFKLPPNAGNLFSSTIKTKPEQPDYWGEFKLDVSSVEVVNGIATFKISGWKKMGTSGKAYLSLAVNNWKGEDQQSKSQEMKDDIEF